MVTPFRRPISVVEAVGGLSWTVAYKEPIEDGASSFIIWLVQPCMLQRQVRQILAVVFAIGLFTAMSVAPVAASEGIDLGGDDGISIGTDGVSVGGDEGVGVGINPEDGVNASVGGDEGVEVGTDGVEVGGTDVTDGVGGTDGVEDVTDGVGGTDGIGDVTGSDVTDGVGVTDAVTDDGLGSVGSQVDDLTSGPAGVDSFQGGLGDGDVPTDPTDIDIDTHDVPEGQRPLTQVLRSLPETDRVGPEDAPIGDDRARVNICDPLNVESEALPVGALPGLGDLPRSLQPPGVPADLVTPEAVFGILLGFAPAPCEVFNPSNPQIDPTDPPDDPRGTLDVTRFGQYDGGGVGLVYWEGTLDDSDDGPSISGMNGGLITPEYGDVNQKLIIDDGRNEYGVDPRFRYNEDGVQYESVLILLGKQAGIEGSCDNLEEYEGDLSIEELQENPLGPCDYTLVGLPNLFGPSDLVGILTSLEEQDGSPVDVGALPINPDALLNL